MVQKPAQQILKKFSIYLQHAPELPKVGMPGHLPTTIGLNERVETVRLLFVRQKTAGRQSFTRIPDVRSVRR